MPLNYIPFINYAGPILLLIRLVLGFTLIYYSIPKIKNPRENATDFEKMGMKPGILWGNLAILIELVGGAMLILGVLIYIPLILFGAEMIIGTLIKKFKLKQTFREYSYDIFLLLIVIVLLTFGPGLYTFL